MIFKNIMIYRDISDNIAIFSTDSLLQTVIGKKSAKCGELMVSKFNCSRNIILPVDQFLLSK